MTTISYTSKQTSLLCVSSATPGEKERETSKIKLLKPAKRGLPCKLSCAYINISRCLFFTLLSCVDPIYVLALASLRERYIDRENTLFDSSLFPHDVSPLPSTPQSPQIIMDVLLSPQGLSSISAIRPSSPSSFPPVARDGFFPSYFFLSLGEVYFVRC